MCNGIVDAAKDLPTETEADNVHLAATPGIGVTLSGETRCLRTIVHVVIEEMVRRLSAA